ncbi:MAG TPA: hypothetical protein VGK73_10440 [Polyangiaceae bacterium]
MSSALRLLWPSKSPSRRAEQKRARSLVPRMAAVRIPDPRQIVMPFEFSGGGPRILVHEGARQALERRLEIASQGPVQLAVTDNLRTMVSQTRVRGTLRIRVHMMFLGAPERVRNALVDYLVHGDRKASVVVGRHIEENSHRIKASRLVTRLRARGRSHDLFAILNAVNSQYFGGAVGDVLITWGRRSRPRGDRRGTIKLGSYSATERLIRVHPVLDREWVPRYFVAFIVYHELLHHVIPARDRSLHPPELLQREREFRHYERALAWEQKHIDRLLRAR